MNPQLDPLLPWYSSAKRDLPWRRTSDPYAIWISEIMLQQTGVSTVIPYFERWLARFPDVESLAAADEAEVLSLWQGLGYYSRARNLLNGARFMVGKDWASVDLLEIPGVGRYTAGAIASIALQRAEPLVDGNVERVYSRLTADATTKPTAKAWIWATSELRAEAPGDWNQALMELGATICTPKNPRCELCPIQNACQGYRLGIAAALPTPVEKPAPIRLSYDVWMTYCGDQIGLKCRTKGEWWHGLWTSPFTVTGEAPHQAQPLHKLKHVVTNHKIEFRLHRVEQNSTDPSLTWFSESELASLPMPAWQRKALKLVGESLPF